MHTERQDDKHGGRVPSKTRKARVAILKKCPFCDWQSMEFFERWFNMLVPAFAKLIFLKPNQPVFLCVAVLQLVGLKHNGHSSGFSCEMIICDVLIVNGVF